MHFLQSPKCTLTLLTAAFLGVFTPSYAQDYTSGLIGYWDMNQSSGTTVPDLSGNGYDGTFYNAPTWQPLNGYIDGALNFDVSQVQGVDLPNDLFDTLTEGTIAAWVYWEGANDFRQILLSGQDGWFEFNIRNGQLDLWTSGCSGGNVRTSGTSPLTPNQWHHVAFTNDATGHKFYIDGVEVPATYSAGNATTSVFFDQCTTAATTEYAIGWTSYLSDTEVFDGRIDEVRVYNRVLSATDIATLYAYKGNNCVEPNGLTGQLIYNSDSNVPQYCNGTEWVAAGKQSPPSSGLVGHWELDETSGSTLTDSSGNGNDGTWSDSADNDVTGETGTGKVNSALIFDGTDDEINAGSDTSLDDIFLNGGSLSAWIYPNSHGAGNYGRILSKGSAGATVGWQFILNGAVGESLAFHTSCNGGDWVWWTTPTGTLPLNEWSHVAVTFNRDSATNEPAFYINGNTTAHSVYVSSGSSASCGTFFSGDDIGDDLLIGQRSDANRTFDGIIDEARVYDRELSAAEIADMYNAQNCQGTGPLTLINTLDTPDSAGNMIIQGNYIYLADNDTLRTYTFDGTNFSLIGTPYDNSGLANSIYSDGTYLYFTTAFPHNLYAATFDGSTFAILDTIALDQPGGEITGDGQYIYVPQNADGIESYSFNGTSFTAEGTWPTPSGQIHHVNFINGYIYAAEDTTDTFYVLSSDGATFSLLDTYTHASETANKRFATDGQYIYVGWASSSNIVQAFSFNGSNLTELDEWSGYGFGSGIWADKNYIYVNRSGGEVVILDFDGTTLTEVNTATNGTSSYSRLTGDGRYIYHADRTDGIRAYGGFSNCYCNNPSYSESSLTYNTTTNTMQFCNGYEWRAMGKTGNGGGGCSSPNGTAGSLTYNSDLNVMQYCEGDEWVAITPKLDTQLTTGLVGHWTLDETSGTTIADSTGNGYDLTASGVSPVTDSVTGPIGNAISFDGTADERIYLNASPNQPPITSHVTLCAWAYNNAGNTGRIAGTSGQGGTFAYDIGYNHFDISADGLNATNTRVSTTAPSNQWYHLCGVYDDTVDTLSLYMDGVRVAGPTAHPSGSLNVSARPFTIGARASSGIDIEFDGSIDDVRLYDRPLSAAEITALYDLGTPPVDITSGLIAHWPLDETSGGTVADISGNGYNGSLNGGMDAATATITGTINTAMQFDGIDDYINASTIPEMQGASTLSLAAWLRRTATGDYVHFGSENGINGGVSVGYSGGTLYFSSYIGGWAYGTYNLNDTNWHHVVMLYDGNGATDTDKIKGYIDGVEVNLSYTGTIPTTTYNNPAHTMKIGQFTSYDTDGDIDDVRIYDRPLSAAEITALYNLGTP